MDSLQLTLLEKFANALETVAEDYKQAVANALEYLEARRGADAVHYELRNISEEDFPRYQILDNEIELGQIYPDEKSWIMVDSMGHTVSSNDIEREDYYDNRMQEVNAEVEEIQPIIDDVAEESGVDVEEVKENIKDREREIQDLENGDMEGFRFNEQEYIESRITQNIETADELKQEISDKQNRIKEVTEQKELLEAGVASISDPEIQAKTWDKINEHNKEINKLNRDIGKDEKEINRLHSLNQKLANPESKEHATAVFAGKRDSARSFAEECDKRAEAAQKDFDDLFERGRINKEDYENVASRLQFWRKEAEKYRELSNPNLKDNIEILKHGELYKNTRKLAANSILTVHHITENIRTAAANFVHDQSAKRDIQFNIRDLKRDVYNEDLRGMRYQLAYLKQREQIIDTEIQEIEAKAISRGQDLSAKEKFQLLIGIKKLKDFEDRMQSREPHYTKREMKKIASLDAERTRVNEDIQTLRQEIPRITHERDEVVKATEKLIGEIKNEKTREKMNKKLDKVKSGFDHER